MQIQVNTDNHIKGRADVVRLVHSCVEGAVGRFADRITRVEVHLSDTNSHKSGGADKRCVLEARLAGLRTGCYGSRRQIAAVGREHTWTAP